MIALLPWIGLAFASPVVTVESASLQLPSGVAVSVGTATASEGTVRGEGVQARQGDLVISADSTEWALNGSKGTFDGNVRAVQGDLTFSCDRVEVELGADGSIRNARATGRVSVVQGPRTAQGQRATFADGRLVLSGDPVVRQGLNEMAGREIIFVVGRDTIECIACTMKLKGELHQ